MHGMSLFTPVSVTQSLCFLLFAEDTDSCFLHLHLYSYIPEAQITGLRFREGAALALGIDTAFVPRSLLVHHRALAQSLPLRFLLGFFLSGSIPLSPQTLFFLHFFPQLPFLLQVESSHVSCFFLLCFLFPSFGSRLSFFPFFPGYSPSTPFLPSPSILQISSYHHRFHFLCHFLSLPAFTLLYSAPTVEQMKNTTLKRPFPPMFSACLLQNSRAS